MSIPVPDYHSLSDPTIQIKVMAFKGFLSPVLASFLLVFFSLDMVSKYNNCSL